MRSSAACSVGGLASANTLARALSVRWCTWSRSPVSRNDLLCAGTGSGGAVRSVALRQLAARPDR